MIGVKFHKGQGLGNQLFTYVSTKSLAHDLNMEHCIFNSQNFGAPRWNQNGIYFLNISVKESHVSENKFQLYLEKEQRLYFDNNKHDMKLGCDVRGYDKELKHKIKPYTLIEGLLQHEDYFIHNKKRIFKWLEVKKEFETSEFCSDDICIINFRGGEYVGQKELFIGLDYYKNSIEIMKQINSSMEFVVITDDVYNAKLFFKKIPCYHFDIAKDYISIKNAKYLILSNSSFPFFAVFTNEVLKFLIAPKYWARFNVSNGYWATNQNIYSGWNYLDRKGKLFSSEQCKNELL
jgi:hypothetical protein